MEEKCSEKIAETEEVLSSCGIMHSHKASKLCKLQLVHIQSKRSIFMRSKLPLQFVDVYAVVVVVFIVRGQFSFMASTTSEDYVRAEWVICGNGRWQEWWRKKKQNVFRRWTIKPSIIIVSKVLLPLSPQPVQSSLSSKTCIPTQCWGKDEREKLYLHYSCKRLSRHHHQHFEWHTQTSHHRDESITRA